MDIHVFTLDGDGSRLYGPAERGELYPGWPLSRIGMIEGRSVRCIGGATSRIQAADAIATMVGARRSADGRPFIVALGGRSGSGKSSVAGAIAERTPSAS